jgi:hypothetical protein
VRRITLLTGSGLYVAPAGVQLPPTPTDEHPEAPDGLGKAQRCQDPVEGGLQDTGRDLRSRRSRLDQLPQHTDPRTPLLCEVVEAPLGAWPGDEAAGDGGVEVVLDRRRR